MVDDPVLAVADELYGLPYPAFTAARDRTARELKSQDRDLAARVRALRKPSVAAWVVNLLVRGETEQVEQLLAVGAALREAQASLDGVELRALTKQRRQVTAAVTSRARSLAAAEGHRVTPAVAEQVEATLTAAMVDATAAEAVRSGLLVGTLAATGVDGVDVAAALAVPEALGFGASPRAAAAARPDLQVVADPDGSLAAAVRDAEEAVAEAEELRSEAEQEALAARRRAEDLQATSLQIQGELDELRRRVAELESRAEDTDEELAAAEERLAEHDHTVATAQATLTDAQARLDELRSST